MILSALYLKLEQKLRHREQITAQLIHQLTYQLTHHLTIDDTDIKQLTNDRPNLTID